MLAMSFLAACAPPRESSPTEQEVASLLNRLETAQDREGTSVGRSCAGESVIGVEALVAEFLSEELDFECSVRSVREEVRGGDALWVFENRDLVAWSKEGGWEDAVFITVFYGAAGGTSANGNLLSLAVALDGLRSHAAGQNRASGKLVLSITEAPTPSGQGWLPPSREGADERTQYTIAMDGEIAGEPGAYRRIPVLPGSHPGWIIGVSGPALAVERIPSNRGNEANNPSGEESSAERGGDSGVVIPAPYGLTIHTAHWIDGTNDETVSIGTLRQQFMEDLRLVLPHVAPPVSAFWSAARNWMAWAAWVVLPLVILFLVTRVLLIEAETVLADLKKRLDRLGSTKDQYERDRKRVEESAENLENNIRAQKDQERQVKAQLQTGAHRETAIGRVKRWFAQQLLRWRTQRLKGRISRNERLLVLERERLGRICDELNGLEAKIGNLCRLRTEWAGRKQRSVKELGSSIWDHLVQHAEDRHSRWAAVTGIIVCAAVFLVGFLAESAETGWCFRGLWVGLVAVVAALALIAARRSAGTESARGIAATSVGAGLVCFVVLDTSELIPFPASSYAASAWANLYDSQLVTLMFGCFGLLVSLHATSVLGQGNTSEYAESARQSLPPEMVQRARRRKKRLLVCLLVTYVLLGLSFLRPALDYVFLWEPVFGVTTVTVVTAAALLLPVFALWFQVEGSRASMYESDRRPEAGQGETSGQRGIPADSGS